MMVNLYYIGRIVIRQKRIDKLITILQHFALQKTNLRLHIFGNGDPLLVEQIMNFQSELIEIVFYGFKKNWIDYIKNDWIQLFFSDYEGCPLSLIEAINAGKFYMVSVDSPGLKQYMSVNCVFDNLVNLANSLESNLDLQNHLDLSIFFDQARFSREVLIMDGILNA